MAPCMSRFNRRGDNEMESIILIWMLAKIRKRNAELRRRRVRRERRWWVRPIFLRRQEQGDYYNLMEEMRIGDNEKHVNFYRMSREHYDELLFKVTPLLQRNRRGRKPIPVGLKLALTLRYLASGDSMVSMSYSERVGQSTCSKIIRQTCDAIWTVLAPDVLPTPSKEMWQEIADDFFQKWNFPNCVGSIDGKHVVIQAPSLSGSNFYNYKNQHSLVLLAACDANFCFTMVDIGASGRQSDGGIFANSTFGHAIITQQLPLPAPMELFHYVLPSTFTADAAFPLLSNVMRPYPATAGADANLIFNYRLSRARRVIENSFGILAARWRIYRRPILASLHTVEGIIKATVVLHNMLQKYSNATRNGYCPPGMVDREDSEGNCTPGSWRSLQLNGLVPVRRTGSNTYSNNSKRIREEFKTYFANEGAVPWQWTRMYRS